MCPWDNIPVHIAPLQFLWDFIHSTKDMIWLHCLRPDKSCPTRICLLVQPVGPYRDVLSLEDFSKYSLQIIWLSEPVILASIHLVLMDQTNQSFPVTLYKIGGQIFCNYNGIIELFHGFTFIVSKKCLHKDLSQKVMFIMMVCSKIIHAFAVHLTRNAGDTLEGIKN